MGPLVGIVLLVYQQAIGKPLPWGWLTALIVTGFAWHFYTELDNEKKKDEPNATPELYLQYDNSYRDDFSNSGFFVRVQGEPKAFNVRLTSEEAVTKNHKRLGIVWETPSEPIGKDPIPVGVSCVYYVGDTQHVYGIVRGAQIRHFFENNAKSSELIVTVDFTDVSGHACPQQRFRVLEFRDVDGHQKIDCQPIKKQDAS